MCVGLGAVATTFITGVMMTRKGLAKPVGSMTQYDKIRVGRGKDKKYLKYGEVVPIADLNDLTCPACKGKKLLPLTGRDLTLKEILAP